MCAAPCCKGVPELSAAASESFSPHYGSRAGGKGGAADHMFLVTAAPTDLLHANYRLIVLTLNWTNCFTSFSLMCLTVSKQQSWLTQQFIPRVLNTGCWPGLINQTLLSVNMTLQSQLLVTVSLAQLNWQSKLCELAGKMCVCVLKWSEGLPLVQQVSLSNIYWQEFLQTSESFPLCFQITITPSA